MGEYSLVRFSGWESVEVCLGGVWRYRIGLPRWSHLRPGEVNAFIETVGEQPTSVVTRKKPF
jgi:hypothetical protein